ncbi:Thiolase-like protein [Pseudocohnilembus persalinus]|uniref:Thiolase-like protein n=1 Tax=Pseudocohnilembus persalinus TaxID=266149 RepID=A0A0V0Q815_PSEPJ|nr:Thiolase-like protein [Pseudocohnilembus persalinus]|eukprot:KRW98365.1 Thiolase-like protein [Pseudocohnilembus persalinus]
MDIVQIGVCHGEKINFMDQVHDSMRARCERYVQKSGGPYTLYREKNGKTPIQYLEEAFKPLQKYKNQIGMVIDGSTTRGFTEPSQASLYAQHLKLTNAICFDVVEACNGFSRALETAYMVFQTQKKFDDQYILIINNEQPPETRAVLPKDDSDYRLVASYYVGLTFSNVCTCTLIKKSNNNSWNFQHHTNTNTASHINIPLPKLAKGFLPHTDDYEVILNEQYGQYCLPRLHQVDTKIPFVFGHIEAMESYYKEANLICHTFSKTVYETMFANHEIGKLSLYYDSCGNLGSCSLPFILHDQYGSVLPKNEKLAWLGNAAGGSDYMLTFQPWSNEEKKEYKVRGKYITWITLGYRVLKNKLLCSKRKNKKVGLKSQ